MADTLFRHIEKLHGKAPWGAVLDAGTGRGSLEWIASLPTTRWTAVTGDTRAKPLARRLGSRIRSQDRIVTGNWTDPLLLHGETFDVVIADYLLGAVDSVSPYFQYRFLERLRPHVGSRLYVVGLEPYPESTEDLGGRVILEIARLRDACILHAGHRPNREYPLEWTLVHLDKAGFVVEDVATFPIVYGPKFVDGQLDVCVKKLPYITDKTFAGALAKHIEALRERALNVTATLRGIRFGEDYVVYARPK